MIPISKPFIGEEEIQAVKEVLESGMLVQGEKVEKFENEFAKYIGCKYGIAVSSGTTALQVGLKALGISKGDEVITTPFSFIATANSILYVGGKPVFADINPETFNIDPEKIEEKITNKTKAVLIVHLFGNPCEMDEIMKICKEHDLFLIEDACQAHGAEYKGKKVGSFGDLSCFSFYATKNMTTGEGGTILTNNEEIAEKAKLLRNHGQEKTYEHKILGFNYRMSDIQAAIGLVQLKKLEEMNKKRMENAKIFNENLSKISWLKIPFIEKNKKHVFHQYTIKVLNGKRDYVLNKLNERGVGAKVYYPKPIHLQLVYKKLGYNENLPVSEEIAKQVLSLPVHPLLTKNDLNKIINEIKLVF